jgi:hypothetical protein
VIDVFTMPWLCVGLTLDSAEAGDPAFALTGRDGQVVARAASRPRSVAGRLQQSFSSNAQYAFTVDIQDPEGGLMLSVDKARVTWRGGFELAVALADRTPLGTARRGWSMSGDTQLLDAAGGRLGRAPGRLRTHYEATDPSGRTLGSVAYAPITHWARPEAADYLRQYHLEFAEDAPIVVRALVIAIVICADIEGRPSGAV